MARSSIFDVPSYGAAGDGSRNDGPEIDQAIRDLTTAGGGVLYFPAGKYLTTTQHRIASIPCRIQGDGVGLSAVEWDTNEGGFHFSGGGFNGNYINSLHVSNLALVTRRRLGGTALFMTWDDGNRSIIQHFVLDNVQVKGAGLYAGADGHMWTRGIHSQRAFNSVLSNVQIIGSASVADTNDIQQTTAAFLEMGSGASTQFLISGFYANFYGTGLHYDKAEGIYMSNFELVLIRTGVKGVGGYVATFSNGHVDHRENGFVFEGASSVRITGCDIQHAQGRPGNAVVFDKCVDVGVSGCSIHGPGDQADYHANGVVVSQYETAPNFPSEMAVITGNAFRWIPDQAVWLQSGTRRNRVTNNVFESIRGSRVLDQGTENVTS